MRKVTKKVLAMALLMTTAPSALADVDMGLEFKAFKEAACNKFKQGPSKDIDFYVNCTDGVDTAYAMAEERESFLADSLADEFFTKPISNYAVLIKAIEELFQKSK